MFKSQILTLSNWIERILRMVKQEYIYQNPADTVDKLRRGIKGFIAYYNYHRPHQGLPMSLPAMKYGVAA